MGFWNLPRMQMAMFFLGNDPYKTYVFVYVPSSFMPLQILEKTQIAVYSCN